MSAVTGRDDTSTDKVCGYVGRGSGPPDDTDNMLVLGGSCLGCTSPAECSGEDCTILGKICCPNSPPGAKTCHLQNPESQPRCVRNTDCDPDVKCLAAGTRRCNTCLPARWKLRGSTPQATCPANLQTKATLYDLATNREEDERLSCLDDPNAAEWSGTACNLYGNLRSFNTCGWGENPICEKQ